MQLAQVDRAFARRLFAGHSCREWSAKLNRFPADEQTHCLQRPLPPRRQTTEGSPSPLPDRQCARLPRHLNALPHCLHSPPIPASRQTRQPRRSRRPPPSPPIPPTPPPPPRSPPPPLKTMRLFISWKSVELGAGPLATRVPSEQATTAGKCAISLRKLHHAWGPAERQPNPPPLSSPHTTARKCAASCCLSGPFTRVKMC